MQFPWSFDLFGHNILWHVVAEPLGMFVGYRYYIFLKKKQGDNIISQNRLWIIVAALFGAILGSRLIGGLENIPELIRSDNKWLYFYQNKTVLGGFLGGVFGVEIIKKCIGEKQNSGDLFVYPMILALIIGRIGCFSMGVYEETYGIPTSLFTGTNLGDGILRHPVTLYEIVFLFICWIALKQLQKKYTFANGLLFKLFIINYCLFRFLLDFIKPHYNIVGFSIIQLTALLGILYYFIIYLSNKMLFSLTNK